MSEQGWNVGDTVYRAGVKWGADTPELVTAKIASVGKKELKLEYTDAHKVWGYRVRFWLDNVNLHRTPEAAWAQFIADKRYEAKQVRQKLREVNTHVHVAQQALDALTDQ